MYKHILHPTDLQENHFSLCEKAKQFADFHGATLYLIHIIEIPQTLLLAQNLGFTELVLPAKEDAKIVLKTLGEALNIPRSHQFVEIGMVKHHILECAEAHQCDLIILGRNHDTSFLGSTNYHIMQHAEADVLTLSNHVQKATSSSKKK